jgi:hypothetical protein
MTLARPTCAATPNATDRITAMITASLNHDEGDPIEQDQQAATGFVASRRGG